jgi:hypothetical protein
MDDRDPEILGEPSRIEIGAPEGVAQRMVATQTITAGVTRDVVGYKDPVAHAVTGDSFTHFDDLSRDFVAEDARCLLDPVPLHHVASANAALQDLDQHLARTDLRGWDFFQSHITVVIVDGHSHG